MLTDWLLRSTLYGSICVNIGESPSHPGIRSYIDRCDDTPIDIRGPCQGFQACYRNYHYGIVEGTFGADLPNISPS